ncbi:MAG: 4-hydroxy-tetrahydrodipicolinate synthase [Planctomycetes bacterium ADurb.Bin126]|nr:MAG: 4-hydroxy-tetrahydrodipicolinate synthase [Planctomycetes bacterium ADurb.Bin126]HOD80880.1 dihydrodipicolinate synthase family protein [Phycisphaerae bacterium]HQL72269.1 dihydrodipicolinate synthase family protein [Phycisphaerae bacterium]
MTTQLLTGLVSAPFTPMHVDGSLNLDAIAPYADLLTRNGVSGAFICGTTGESLSLTLDERVEIAQEWVSAARDELKVIVHVGGTCLADCQTLAREAQDAGAAAIGVMAPCFFKPPDVQALVDWCQAIASAGPNLPFYFYHLPSMTGVSFAMADFLPQAAGRIPSLAGVKFTYEDLDDYQRCLAFDGGRLNVLFGRDEILVQALRLGARGAVGSTYNFAPGLYKRIIAAHEAGDSATADALQKRAVDMIDTCIRASRSGTPAFKAVMKMIGLDCGPARLPLRPLSDDEAERLRDQLQALGFFEYCAR